MIIHIIEIKYFPVIARSAAAKQPSLLHQLGCFASLAMTVK
jgi:hypothetical protein